VLFLNVKHGGTQRNHYILVRQLDLAT